MRLDGYEWRFKEPLVGCRLIYEDVETRTANLTGFKGGDLHQECDVKVRVECEWQAALVSRAMYNVIVRKTDEGRFMNYSTTGSLERRVREYS